MCLGSVWTQPPYNDKNSLHFFNPQKPKQSQLSSHFDFGVNTFSTTIKPSVYTYEEFVLVTEVYGVGVHCGVCALGWVKCRAQILSIGQHTGASQ